MVRRTAALAACAGALFCAGRAQAIGIGLEGGGAATYVSGLPNGEANSAGSANLGLIVENSFGLALVFLDLWADVQTPLRLQVGGSDSTSIIPIDLGLRVGLTLGPIQPYVGVLGQLGIVNSSTADSAPLKSPFYGLGGDLGLDIAFFILRVGVELRGVETVGLTDSGSLSAFELEGLASARLAF